MFATACISEAPHEKHGCGAGAQIEPSELNWELVKAYRHDSKAFTQGLYFEDGYLYEGTGLNGYSSLRKVELETGRVLEKRALPRRYFGEGIATLGTHIYQLTWLSGKGFIYDKNSLNKVGEFSYATQGWGLTENGQQLIMSNGSASLYFLNPKTLLEVGRVTICNAGRPQRQLNELEYIESGKRAVIAANVYQSNTIVFINPSSGAVRAQLDLSPLIDRYDLAKHGVLNGIAYDDGQRRLFVTGKRWPLLFELRLLGGW